jgi:hypothetical protein
MVVDYKSRHSPGEMARQFDNSFTGGLIDYFEVARQMKDHRSFTRRAKREPPLEIVY